jgi:ribosomal protein L37E
VEDEEEEEEQLFRKCRRCGRWAYLRKGACGNRDCVLDKTQKLNPT